MIGERIRAARASQRLSLSDVASRAEISIATLSRIETSKQALDVELFMTLAKILKTTPRLLLDDDETPNATISLASQIEALGPKERLRLWRDLAAARRSRPARMIAARDVEHQVDELLAQLDYLRDEITSVRKRLRKR
jgi:transcriptional regulator with XRE-family HTH domain